MRVEISVEQLVKFLMSLYQEFDTVNRLVNDILKDSIVTVGDANELFDELEGRLTEVLINVDQTRGDFEIEVSVNHGRKDKYDNEMMNTYYGNEVMCKVEMKGY